MCSEMGFCFVPLFSLVCINPGDTMKEPVRREHLLRSGLLISFFGQRRISPAVVRGRAGACPAACCHRPAFPCLTCFSAAIPPPAARVSEEEMRAS